MKYVKKNTSNLSHRICLFNNRDLVLFGSSTFSLSFSSSMLRKHTIDVDILLILLPSFFFSIYLSPSLIIMVDNVHIRDNDAMMVFRSIIHISFLFQFLKIGLPDSFLFLLPRLFCLYDYKFN